MTLLFFLTSSSVCVLHQLTRSILAFSFSIRCLTQFAPRLSGTSDLQVCSAGFNCSFRNKKSVALYVAKNRCCSGNRCCKSFYRLHVNIITQVLLKLCALNRFETPLRHCDLSFWFIWNWLDLTFPRYSQSAGRIHCLFWSLQVFFLSFKQSLNARLKAAFSCALVEG